MRPLRCPSPHTPAAAGSRWAVDAPFTEATASQEHVLLIHGLADRHNESGLHRGTGLVFRSSLALPGGPLAHPVCPVDRAPDGR